MSGKLISVATVVFTLSIVRPSLARQSDDVGFEIGVRTGYAFPAGSLGAPANGTDQEVSTYIDGQWPLWLDVGYRFAPEWYLGGYAQYGIASVNEDRQNGCRNASVDCSAHEVRLGLMGRYHLPPFLKALPWLGLGLGIEWAGFSFHQSLLGNTDTDVNTFGYEFANLQAGVDFRLAQQLVLGPFVSFSMGQFQDTSSTTRYSNGTATTSEQDLAKKSLHEWLFIGVRVAFLP